MKKYDNPEILEVKYDVEENVAVDASFVLNEEDIDREGWESVLGGLQ